MMYCIEGFNQEKAIEFGLNFKELLILKWFKLFANSKRMKRITYQGEDFYWIFHKHILEELPILEIKTTRSVRRILNALVFKGMLRKIVIRQKLTFYSIVYEKFLQLLTRINNQDKIVQVTRTKLSYHRYQDQDSKIIKDTLKNLRIFNGKVL